MLKKLIAVARTSSKESSLRITLPKKVTQKLNVSESEHIGFYEIRGKRDMFFGVKRVEVIKNLHYYWFFTLLPLNVTFAFFGSLESNTDF